MGDLAWELLAEQLVYSGFVSVVRRTYRMPDGTNASWDVTDSGRSVAVLARTTLGLFVTVRQFRAGPGTVLDELPGGSVEDEESIEDAAARELREESGYVAGEIQVVGSTWLAAGSRLEQFVAVATGCTRSSRQDLDPEEFIEVQLRTQSAMIAPVRGGNLTDTGLAYRAFDHLGVIRFDPAPH